MNKKNYMKVIAIYLFTFVFAICFNNLYSQDNFFLNPKMYLTPKKFNNEIKSIRESEYRLYSSDTEINYDTIIVINEKEYKLKRNSYSMSEFIPCKETVTHYDLKGNSYTIWTYNYDNSGNLLCSILNYKERKNENDNWANVDDGFKYCQSYDENQRIIKMTQQNGVDSIQNNLILSYRHDSLINKINLSDPWGEEFLAYQAIVLGDTIRYIQSFEFANGKENQNDMESLDKLPKVNIDLVKENNGYSFYHKEIISKSNTVSVLEKHVFDKKWNEMETIKFNDGKVNFHKIYNYNGENQIVEIQDLIENSSETFKYDNKGNLILADNNYLLMYKNYDKNNNVGWIIKYLRKLEF